MCRYFAMILLLPSFAFSQSGSHIHGGVGLMTLPQFLREDAYGSVYPTFAGGITISPMNNIIMSFEFKKGSYQQYEEFSKDSWGFYEVGILCGFQKNLKWIDLFAQIGFGKAHHFYESIDDYQSLMDKHDSKGSFALLYESGFSIALTKNIGIGGKLSGHFGRGFRSLGPIVFIEAGRLRL